MRFSTGFVPAVSLVASEVEIAVLGLLPSDLALGTVSFDGRSGTVTSSDEVVTGAANTLATMSSAVSLSTFSGMMFSSAAGTGSSTAIGSRSFMTITSVSSLGGAGPSSMAASSRSMVLAGAACSLAAGTISSVANEAGCDMGSKTG